MVETTTSSGNVTKSQYKANKPAVNAFRAFAYLALLAGAGLILARIVVTRNEILTSGIILLTVGMVSNIIIIDFFKSNNYEPLYM
ncbi:hypothetical protein KFE25_005900 [Diacronema lutheri]|uniref:Uncharacterized protein n=1 Tax=Diacronema lutheri TaxID=2081491 RepID=A0A8J6CGS8_DIALT|nr:hypothetical protein KFE25_005900 [Diacronema lutheri]